MRWTRIAIFAAAAVAFAATARPQDADRDAPGAKGEKTVDRLGAAIERRIAGTASADDVRIDADWRRKSAIVACRVYGNGVGIWRDQTQFTLTHAEVLDLLRAIQAARFSAMEKTYGGEEGQEESEKQKEKEKEKETIYLRGSVSVRVGSDLKRVGQYMDGEQSKALATLAGKILAVSEKAAKTGVGATSLSDGLTKLGEGKLAPETLQVFAQNRADRPGEGHEDGNWVLRIDGRRVLDRTSTDAKTSVRRLLILSEDDFRKLAEALRDADPQGLPRNLYASQMVNVEIRLLAGRANLSARQYAGKTAETLGEKQVAFDRLYAALRALHERVEKQGAVQAENAD
jgi:hypothetical protein